MDSKFKPQHLQELFPNNWYSDAQTSSMRIHVYPMLKISANSIRDKFNDSIDQLNDGGYPIWLRYVGLNSMNILNVRIPFLYANFDTGETVISTQQGMESLPPSCYLFLATPFKVDGKELGENNVIQRLRCIESLLSIYIGNNLVHSLIHAVEYPALIGSNYNVSGEFVAVPQKCDGPFLEKDNWEYIKIINQTIEKLEDNDKKLQIKRALHFYNRGKNVKNLEEKFFFYWTSITILSGETDTKEINKKFQIIYKFTETDVNQKLYWQAMVNCRNHFFKRGDTINFHTDIERHFQNFFADLLHYELGIDSLNLTLSNMEKLQLDSLRSNNSV